MHRNQQHKPCRITLVQVLLIRTNGRPVLNVTAVTFRCWKGARKTAERKLQISVLTVGRIKSSQLAKMYSYHQGSFELHKLKVLAASHESHTFWAQRELKETFRSELFGDNFYDYIICELLHFMDPFSSPKLLFLFYFSMFYTQKTTLRHLLSQWGNRRRRNRCKHTLNCTQAVLPEYTHTHTHAFNAIRVLLDVLYDGGSCQDRLFHLR